VVKELEKRCRAAGSIKNKQLVRALAQKAHPHYQDKGKSDDLCRFLLNVGVLIEPTDERCLYFDEERAVVIIECCEQGCEPEQASDPETRILEIKQREDVSDADEESAEPPLSSAPTTQAGATPAGPPKPEQHVTHVVFLTPVEQDVWISICTMVTDDEGTFSFRAPNEPEALYREWASKNLGCSAEEYDAAFRSFVARGLLEEWRPDDEEDEEDNDIYRLTRDPTKIHVVSISERPAKVVTRLDLDIVKALERDFRLEQGVALAKLVAQAVGGLVPEDKMSSCYTKMVGGPNTIDHKYSYWGIIFRQPSEGKDTETFVCIPGFERFTFELKDVEQDLPLWDPTASVNDTASTTMPSPKPAPWEIDEDQPSERRVVITPPPANSIPALEAPSSPATPASEDEQRRRRIEAMDDAELERKLDEWRRMLETLPLSIALAEAEQRRRARALERKRLAAQLEALRADQERLEQEARSKAEEADRLASALESLKDS